ncbi:helix-turn-helix domain-containing protein [Teredinibacter purpureus]|uniref:hypothetical protein n=1 Tax=Teredinibacter purpureus TaxID=2731756 RepID=UPI0005F79C5E|nr:hypothetical protein [Teredinibacter purpureus]
MDRLRVIGIVGGEGHGRNARFARRVNEAIDLLWLAEGLAVSSKPVPLAVNVIWGWANDPKLKEKPLPAEYVRPAVRAAKILGVELGPHDLRPDVYGQPLAA